MESIEVSAKTVEEAVQLALEQLGLSSEEIEVTVVKNGKSGFLGLGAEEAMVKVTPLSQAAEEDEVATLAKGTLKELLSLMRMPAEVELKPYLAEGAGSEGKTIALEVMGEDLGILIGRRGETLASLQYILRHIMAHRQKAMVPLTVDIEGYKQRRYRALRELALNLARKAKSTGQSMTLEPMPADERRVVHLALSVNHDVATQSIGEGEVRKVVIQPRKR
ncbi:RNA-binding cell elongation regulator Jag/EloR [Chloroflexota bacterium]